MAYICINKEFFEKKKAAAWANEIANVGKEEAKDYCFDDLPDSDTVFKSKTEIEEIEDDGTIHIKDDNALGYFALSVKLDDDDFIRIFEILTKKMNKIKTVLEGLK